MKSGQESRSFTQIQPSSRQNEQLMQNLHCASFVTDAVRQICLIHVATFSGANTREDDATGSQEFGARELETAACICTIPSQEYAGKEGGHPNPPSVHPGAAQVRLSHYSEWAPENNSNSSFKKSTCFQLLASRKYKNHSTYIFSIMSSCQGIVCRFAQGYRNLNLALPS